MDTEKARIYLTAVELGSFSAAADELGYTTSGISRSIAALEDETGFLMLYRGHEGVRPTQDAQKLIPIMRDLVYQEKIYRAKADEICGLITGKVTIGVCYATFFKLFNRAVKKFKEVYPNIEIQTMQGTTSFLLREMDAHNLDLVIASRRPEYRNFVLLRANDMVACVPEGHPAIARGWYDMKDFETDAVVAPYPDEDTDYRRVWKAREINPNYRYTATDVYATYCMIEAGLGVFLFNAIELEQVQGNAVVLPVHPNVRTDIGITYPDKTQMTTAAIKFLDALLELT